MKIKKRLGGYWTKMNNINSNGNFENIEEQRSLEFKDKSTSKIDKKIFI